MRLGRSERLPRSGPAASRELSLQLQDGVSRPMPAIKFLAMPFGDLRRRLDQSVIYDWAMRCPIMIYCSFLLCRDVVGFCQQVAHDPAAFQQFDTGSYVAM